MSVNDPLPWIDQLCSLIRDAVANDIPVIGHCLGGQMISKALGGKVTHPVKEIGWSQARAETGARARSWMSQWIESNDGMADVLFQWHGETFGIPPGGQLLLSNDYCTNQMFAYGPHLAMQCHIEMTVEMIEEWCRACLRCASWPTSCMRPGSGD